MRERSAGKLQLWKCLSYLPIKSSGGGLTVREIVVVRRVLIRKVLFLSSGSIAVAIPQASACFFRALCICTQDLYSLLFASSRS